MKSRMRQPPFQDIVEGLPSTVSTLPEVSKGAPGGFQSSESRLGPLQGHGLVDQLEAAIRILRQHTFHVGAKQGDVAFVVAVEEAEQVAALGHDGGADGGIVGGQAGFVEHGCGSDAQAGKARTGFDYGGNRLGVLPGDIGKSRAVGITR